MPKRPPMKPRRAWVIVDPKGFVFEPSAWNGTRKQCIDLWTENDPRTWAAYAAEGWTCRLVRIEEVKR